MQRIFKLEGADLDAFLSQMSGPADDIYRVRIAIDGDQIKVKVNESAWSWPLGVEEVAG